MGIFLQKRKRGRHETNGQRFQKSLLKLGKSVAKIGQHTIISTQKVLHRRILTKKQLSQGLIKAQNSIVKYGQHIIKGANKDAGVANAALRKHFVVIDTPMLK